MTLFTLFLACGAIILIPFIPTMMEMLSKTDLDPLKISNQTLKDPRSGPDYLFWHLANLLALENLDELKKKVSVGEATFLNPTLLAIPPGQVSIIPAQVARLISASTIELLPNKSYLSKIFSMGSIVTGTDNKLNEMHAQDQLVIASGSKVVWWATGNEVHLHSKVSVPGRVQGKKEVVLDAGVYFHLLDAPLIRTAQPSLMIKTAPREIRAPDQKRPTLRRIEAKDFEIGSGEIFLGDLIVKGNLKIGAGARIYGSLKCHQQLSLEPGVQVFGNIVSLGDLHFLGDDLITGSILCSKKISFASGCKIGTSSQRITCSAHEIVINGNFQAHGTLRAWKSGITHA